MNNQSSESDPAGYRKRWSALCGAIGLGVTIGLASAAGVAQANIITVTTTSDSISATGCTLRQAITNANNPSATSANACGPGSGDDTIFFSVSGTITLIPTQGALPAIANTLTIDGTGQTIAISDANYLGMFVNGGATLTLNDLTIENATNYISRNGGGIYNDGTLTVTNSTFSDNTATKGSGGGIYNDGTLTVTNSTFSDNTATTGNPEGDFGGGIYNAGTAYVTNSTFYADTGWAGGGIYNAGTAYVTNSTFSDNMAYGPTFGTGLGGGIANDGTLTVTNSTFSDNTATSGVSLGAGAGIANTGTETISNTILASNSPDNCYGVSASDDGGYNFDDDGSCNFSATGSQSDVSDSDLALGSLQDNGGPTETIALQSGSVAIDQIPAKYCPATDQRGYVRPDDGEKVCDVGAYESDATPLSAKLDLDPSIGGFDLNSTLAVSSGTTIDPTTQAVTIQIGPSYTVTIPSGSFVEDKKGAYVFQGTIGNVSLQVKIAPNGDGTYTLQAQGSGADLNGITNPVTVTVTIGGYTVSTSVTAGFN